MVLIVMLLIVQIWLLSATLESYLAGHREAALPGAIISAILFAACLGLYLFVERIDRAARKWASGASDTATSLPGSVEKRRREGQTAKGDRLSLP